VASPLSGQTNVTSSPISLTTRPGVSAITSKASDSKLWSKVPIASSSVRVLRAVKSDRSTNPTQISSPASAGSRLAFDSRRATAPSWRRSA